MNVIEFDIPIKEGSIIQFVVDDVSYPGKVIRGCTTGKYYIMSADGKCFSGSMSKNINHYDFVDNIFNPLNKSAKEYYFNILGYSNSGHWPETSLEDLEKVLLQMQRDYKKTKRNVKTTIDFSKFRFRIGDTITYEKTQHKICAYYFSEFNNYELDYGYVIDGIPYGHDGNDYGYDENGVPVVFSDIEDKFFIEEDEALPYNVKQLKTNENEIKLQRTKAVISRGTVPTGYRVRSKVNKTTISSQPLSYTKIVRGS